MKTINVDIPITIVDGVEYTNNGLVGWEEKLARVWTLDDGTKTTSRMVADRIGCTGTCARARLKVHTDPKKIYKPVRVQIRSKNEPRTTLGEDLLDPKGWYKDPMVKLVLKNI